MNDTLLKKTVLTHLINNFGHVQTERFIALIIKEPFDYTKWQNDLFEELSVYELSRRAMENRALKNTN